MNTEIFIIDRKPEQQDIVFPVNQLTKIPSGYFSNEELKYIKRQKSDKKDLLLFNRLDYHLIIWFLKEEKNSFLKLEQCRKAGDNLTLKLNELKSTSVAIYDAEGLGEETAAFVEGMVLGNYQFLKYKKDKEKSHTLRKIFLFSEKISIDRISELSTISEAVYHCRTLINEPFSCLNTTSFSKEVVKLGKKCGAKVEVMNKQKIESLKMGGLLAVNQGSEEPPAFIVMDWNPLGAINKKPIIFIGKGVVYDSGGMNLKPGDSMTNMKDDMSGAAAVACAIYAIATAELQIHVIGLMPVTDNKIGPKAILPGDIITMFNGTTVEVINTDAEGRLILADALSYASRYKPELVIDLATLTGAAVRAIGKFGIVAMQKNAEKQLDRLKQSGWQVFERIVEFPSWDEYGDLIKSEIADLKNLGPGEAGAITAGKFLQSFSDYPYIHLDIAGPAFLDTRDSYRGKGGTGVGVRLLYDFIKKI